MRGLILAAVLAAGCDGKPKEDAARPVERQDQSNARNKKPAEANLTSNVARELMDTPEAAKGKSFTMILAPTEIRPTETIRDYVGRDVEMTGVVESVNVRLILSIPKDVPVPNTRWSDRLVVSFDCTAGDLKRGNVVTRVDRP